MISKNKISVLLILILSLVCFDAYAKAAKKKDKDEQEDKSPPSYTLKSEKEKIYEKREDEVYSAKTTKYITYEQVKNQLGKFEYLYVTQPRVLTIHRYTYAERLGNRVQNMGYDGSSTRHLFFQVPDEIGGDTGYYNFDIYAIDIDQVRFYDTKSPYTYVFIMPMKKTSRVNFGYAQNVTPEWNIGGDFSYFSVAEPWHHYPRMKYIMSRSWDLFTHFKDPEEKYHLFISFVSFKHYMNESLQTKVPNDTNLYTWDKDDRIPISMFRFPNVNLGYPKNGKPKFLSGRNGKNTDRRSILNIYQQYQFDPNYEGFYEFRYSHLENTIARQDPDEIEDVKIEASALRDITLHSFSNEVGFKSSFSENFIYVPYVRRKDILRRYYHLKLDDKDNYSKHHAENYIGLRTNLEINEEENVKTFAEYLFFKNYKFGVGYYGKYLEGSVKHVRKMDPFIYRYLKVYGDKPDRPSEKLVDLTESNSNWEYPFPLSTQLYGAFKTSFWRAKVKPNVTFNAIGRTYTNNAYVLSPGTDIDFTFGPIHLDNSAVFSFNLKSSKPYYSVPLFFINSSIYYLNKFYKDKLEIAGGLDINYKTKFKAPQYSIFDSPYGMMFIEDTRGGLIGGYPVCNLFLSLGYNHFILFGKITHINQGLPQRGYKASYNEAFPYPGQFRSYDLGVYWSFFE